MQIVFDYVQVSPEVFSKTKEELLSQKCLCLKCKIEINHEILVNIRKHIIYDEENYIRVYEFFKILKCINCYEISFQHKLMNPDDAIVVGENIYGEAVYEEYADIRTYPIRNIETISSKNFEKILPEEIYNTYEEVVFSLNNKMPLLTGLGLRTLLEQIVKYFGHSDDLGQILNIFEKEGFISTKQRGLLDKIRYLGNDAAHRTESKTRRELILHLKVLENLIQQLFVYYKLDQEEKKGVKGMRLKLSPGHPIPVVRETTHKRNPKKKL